MSSDTEYFLDARKACSAIFQSVQAAIHGAGDLLEVVQVGKRIYCTRIPVIESRFDGIFEFAHDEVGLRHEIARIGSIARVMRRSKSGVIVLAGQLDQAASAVAVAIARGFVAPRGLNLAFIAGFDSVEMADGQKLSAIILKVILV